MRFLKLDDNHMINVDYIYQVQACEDDENGFKSIIIDDNNQRFYVKQSVQEIAVLFS
ncbi:hypothetical protein [Zophobihabitans entericus]|uniref:Uncharacterized protein n=1 Tax=Zophobihabitans entericus TaxID=1635327 RepID=A0A6G9IBC7_9GAMM|nr:hypothetical protein [Zophobihabitans entericus]QIQ21014.1 hypothetical protein IPMB12_04560 [Zophobihabitans entericus]